MLSNPFAFISYAGYITFFFELVVIQFLFMRKFARRSFFWIRLSVCVAVSVAFVFFPTLPIGAVNTAFFFVLAYVICCAAFCFKANVFNCIFYGLTAWAVQHMAWSFYLIACMLFKMDTAVTVVVYLGIYAVTYTAMFFAFSFGHDDYVIHRERLMAGIISAVVLFVTTVLYDFSVLDDGYSVWTSLYAAILSLVILFVQFGILSKDFLRRKSEQLELDKATLEKLLYSRNKQQMLTNETVEIINRKCHDLKHQISLLRSEHGARKDAFLDEIEKAVMVYGDIAKTGNNALDITLTEKCLLCGERGVKFTYIVDGESLNVLDPVDVSALFGNILDNAIESVASEPAERKIIRLNVSVVHGYLRIHCENYCGHDVAFENGLPAPDPQKGDYHGFGTRSIRYIAEKYDGNVVMERKDELFNVNIIIPIQ